MSDDVKRVGHAPEERFEPQARDIEFIWGVLKRKVEDMDRVGEIAAAYMPVTLGPNEVRTLHRVMQVYRLLDEEALQVLRDAIRSVEDDG